MHVIIKTIPFITLLLILSLYIVMEPVKAIVLVDPSLSSLNKDNRGYGGRYYNIYRVGNVTETQALGLIKKILEYLSSYSVFKFKYPSSINDLKPIVTKWIDAKEYVYGYEYSYLDKYTCTCRSRGETKVFEMYKVEETIVVDIDVEFDSISFSILYGRTDCIEFSEVDIGYINITKVLMDLLELTGLNKSLVHIDIVENTGNKLVYRAYIDDIKYCSRCTYYSGYYRIVVNNTLGVIEFTLPYFPSITKVAKVSIEEYSPEEILAYGIDNAVHDMVRENTIKLLDKAQSTPNATMIYRGPEYMYVISGSNGIYLKPAYVYYIVNVPFRDGDWHDIIVVIDNDGRYRLLNLITTVFVGKDSSAGVYGETFDPHRVIRIYNSLSGEEGL